MACLAFREIVSFGYIPQIANKMDHEHGFTLNPRAAEWQKLVRGSMTSCGTIMSLVCATGTGSLALFDMT